MLALTFSARAIHNATLPHITVKRAEQVYFPVEYTDDNGNIQECLVPKTAISAEQLNQGVYIVYRDIVNGEERDFVRRADITVGQEYNGYIEIVSGINFGDYIVVESDRNIVEGEVIINYNF